MFGSEGITFSVWRVSLATITLEIVLLRKRHFFQKYEEKKTCLV